jgi:pyruvate dehydrogenase E2 component (dihydrolipoamide acetyltransferase)
MAIDVKLPNLGDGIESADVLEVLVKEGDNIAKDQGLVEVETDKATVQVPSSHAGKITKVHVHNGDKVKVGATLVSLEGATADSAKTAPAKTPAAKTAAEKKPAEKKPAEKTSDAKKDAGQPAAGQPAAGKPAKAAASSDAPSKKTAAPSGAEAAQPAAASEKTAAGKSSDQPAADDQSESAAAAQVAAPAARTGSEDDHGDAVVPAGPAVRRFAREVGVDLGRVQGSGPGGRILREDVLEVVRQANQAASGNRGPGSAMDAWGPIRVEKLTKIRRTIAERMHLSWSTVPRVTNFDDADVTELERIRESSKADYANKGVKLTTLPFLIKAVAMSLKTHQQINAALDMENDQIIYKDYVNVGIAVDSERGLVVPVMRSVDTRSIPDIARGLSSMAEMVRKNEYSIDDLRGGTFTISNLGAIGGTYSTPIVNVPEVAILLVGRSRKLPVVVDDQVVPRLMMPLSLSYDHRLVDGAAAARFLNDVIDYLETPSRLLLAP